MHKLIVHVVQLQENQCIECWFSGIVSDGRLVEYFAITVGYRLVDSAVCLLWEQEVGCSNSLAPIRSIFRDNNRLWLVWLKEHLP